MNSTLNKIIFLCLITHGLAANTPKLSDIYQDAITFSPDLATAKATLTESRGLQFENIYNFVPAPLIAYDLKNNDYTYKDGTSTNSKPELLSVTMTQTISAPKIFSVFSANRTVDSAKASLKSEYSSVLNSVVTEYATILSNYEALMALKAQSDYLQKVYRQEQEKFRLGASTKANVAQAKASYDITLAGQVNAKLAINTSLNELYLITGINYASLPLLAEDIQLKDKLVLKSHQAYTDTSLQTNNNIQASKLSLKSNQDKLAAAATGFVPFITYGVTYTNNHDQSDYLTSQTIEESTVSSVGLALNLASNPGTIIEQRGALDAAIASNRNIVTGTLTQLSSAYDGVLASTEAIRRYQTAVSSAKISLKATQASYNAGTMTLLDVLDSLQELQSNETELSKTKYALITYYTQLRILAGDTPENILHTLDQTMGKAVNLRKIKV